MWNIRTNTPWAALTLAGHSGPVRCLHLYGNRLVSGSTDRTIKVAKNSDAFLLHEMMHFIRCGI